MSENAIPVTKAVEQIVSDMPLLQDAFNKKIVNFSALSREIKTDVEKICNRKVSTEAILVALTKQSLVTHSGIVEQLEKLVSGIDISMRSGVVDVCLARNAEVYSALSSLSKQVDWSRGELLCIIQCTGEMAVIADHLTHKKLLGLIAPENVIYSSTNLSMISLRYSSNEFLSCPGGINYFTQLLVRHGVNLIDVETAFKELDFLVDEKDGPRTYALFSDAIRKARQKTTKILT